MRFSNYTKDAYKAWLGRDFPCDGFPKCFHPRQDDKISHCRPVWHKYRPKTSYVQVSSIPHAATGLQDIFCFCAIRHARQPSIQLCYAEVALFKCWNGKADTGYGCKSFKRSPTSRCFSRASGDVILPDSPHPPNSHVTGRQVSHDETCA